MIRDGIEVGFVKIILIGLGMKHQAANAEQACPAECQKAHGLDRPT
jgi:hypothetical protein